ncbi:scabin-related ADP-ribosyltransferase [Streptomyces sp. ScaeMP-e48]|uniref:scabin-related ADP-ribosyltransferase n=1 Tax=Streptomyces sp. ScaeMP-e48 TaxID=1100823 RepID=UPI0015D50E6C|nr:DUF6531 domain-containing protein [Streptomyces sp. ScaeMP-e48]
MSVNERRDQVEKDLEQGDLFLPKIKQKRNMRTRAGAAGEIELATNRMEYAGAGGAVSGRSGVTLDGDYETPSSITEGERIAVRAEAYYIVIGAGGSLSDKDLGPKQMEVRATIACNTGNKNEYYQHSQPVTVTAISEIYDAGRQEGTTVPWPAPRPGGQVSISLTFNEKICEKSLKDWDLDNQYGGYYRGPNGSHISLNSKDGNGDWPDFTSAFGQSINLSPFSNLPESQTYGTYCGSNSSGANKCQTHKGIGVNTATGAFSTSSVDASIVDPSPFDFTRNYSSNNSKAGSLGAGWSAPWEAALDVSQNGEVRFASEDGSDYRYTKETTGEYVGEIKAHSALLETADGFRLETNGGESLKFDRAGRLLERETKQGRKTSFRYSSTAKPAEIVTSSGKSAHLFYDANRLSRVELSDGRTISYRYAEGRLVGVTGVDKSSMVYGYDDAGRLNSVTDARANVILQNFYNSSGKIESQTDASGSIFKFAYRGNETDGTAPDGGVWTDVYKNNVLLAEYDPFGNRKTHAYNYKLDPISTTDARGNTVLTRIDPSGRLVGQQGPITTESWSYLSIGLMHRNKNGKYSTYSNSPQGLLDSSQDPMGKVTKYSYTADGLMESVTSPEGRKTSFGYDSKRNRVTTNLAGGQILTRTFDEAGRVLTQVDPRGNRPGGNPSDFTSVYTYDDAGRVLTQKDAKGRIAVHEYDAAGNLKKTVEAQEWTTVREYDRSNRLIEVIAPGQISTKYTYDVMGNLESTTKNGTEKTSYTHDKAGRMVSMTMPRGNAEGVNPATFTWRYGYDAVGNRTTVTNPAGKTTLTEYDAENRPVAVTDPLGNVTKTEYDGEGNVVKVTDALKKTTTNIFDDNGRIKSMQDRVGKVHTYEYDDDGNLKSEKTPLGNKTTYAYDLGGRVIEIVEPRGNVVGADPENYTWRTGYDEAGNVVSEKDPLGHEATNRYDAVNNVVETSDRRGKKTSYEYDALHRLKKIIAPDTGTTALEYDDAGRISKRTDGNQNFSAYEYSTAGHLARITDPLKRSVAYEYDLDGNRTKITNARGQSITTTYDGRGLRGVTTYSDGTPKVTFTYYDNDLPRTIVDGTGTRTLTYDAERRPLSITQPGVTNPFKYTYNANGTIASRTYPDGRATTFAYDDDARVKTQTTNAKTTTYTWDPANNLTTTQLPTTTARTETRTYDLAGRIDSASEGTGTRHFTRDPNGRVIGDTYKDLTTTRPTMRFAYDDTGRLTRTCTDTTTSCLTGTTGESYTYDRVGNRKTTVSAAGTTTDSHDAANQLTQRVAGTTTTKMTYDADGNLTKDATGSYTYTAEGQAKTATVGTNTYTFGYDADGNRTTAAVNGTASRITTWDINNPLPQIATDRSAANVLVGDYQYNPLGIAQQMDTPKGSFYLQHDRQGSVTNVYDAAGTETYKYTYGPWGTTTGTASTTGGQISLFGYTGQYKNPYVPNQLDLRARTYSSATGRFTTTDPEPTEPGDPNSSPYAYANNDPINQSDPSGRCPLCVSAGIGALIGGAIEGGIYGWQHRNDANFSWQGLAGATARGAVTGAVAGALMPGVGNAVSRGLGLSGLRSLGASTAVNAGVGAGFAWGVNQVHCRPTDPWDLIFGASGGAASSLTGPAFSWLRGLKGKAPATNPFPHISAPAKSIVFPKRVFRGDSRSPEEVFANGFKAEPMKAPFDLQQYGWYNTGSASVIGTSKKANLAMQFPQKAKGSTWVYEIAHPGAGIDMNKALGMKYIFTSEKEIIFPGGILPSQIVRAVRWSWGSPTKQVVENPGYSP